MHIPYIWQSFLYSLFVTSFKLIYYNFKYLYKKNNFYCLSVHYFVFDIYCIHTYIDQRKVFNVDIHVINLLCYIRSLRLLEIKKFQLIYLLIVKLL